ncbi:sensor histidine kinase [Archangium violaceum]|uniref:sensor histidine kinase n=1 Tax=Archangium violaceum TaxID=83451 RepID=UPI001EF70FFD|nr:histidine kinase [Archangium violaceum]
MLALFGLLLAMGLWQGSAVRLNLLGDGSRQPWSRPFLWELTGSLSAWLCLPIIRVAVLNAPGPRVGWARFLGLHGVAFLLYTALHITVMVGSRHLLYPWLGWGAYEYGPLVFRVPMEVQKDLIGYAVVATVWSFLDTMRERQARALHAARLEGELRTAQLQSLTGQLNPHFLFNALNTVSAVMYEDLSRTDRLLSDLGQLLRASLEHAGPTWTLAEERTHTQRFVDILTARFGERLRVRWEVAPGLEPVQVPRFALQTLVENAVKHNQDRREPLEVRIRARGEGGGWALEVEDTGRGLGEPSPAGGTGVGLEHLTRVLALLHGERARLERGSGPEGGARVTLLLPREVTV